MGLTEWERSRLFIHWLVGWLSHWLSLIGWMILYFMDLYWASGLGCPCWFHVDIMNQYQSLLLSVRKSRKSELFSKQTLLRCCTYLLWIRLNRFQSLSRDGTQMYRLQTETISGLCLSGRFNTHSTSPDAGKAVIEWYQKGTSLHAILWLRCVYHCNNSEQFELHEEEVLPLRWISVQLGDFCFICFITSISFNKFHHCHSKPREQICSVLSAERLWVGAGTVRKEGGNEPPLRTVAR